MKLNIASGANVFIGWTNTDLTDIEDEYLRHLRGLDVSQMGGWPLEQVELSKAITAGQVQFFRHDLRFGYGMFADGSVEAIYLGQLVEHLHPHTELPKLLKECRRLLKMGGALRITTPDIEKIVQLYTDGLLDRISPEQPAFYASASHAAKLSYLLFGASGADCTRESYAGHFHVWSYDDLRALLLEAGFGTVDRVQSPGARFPGVMDYGMSHSMGIEATK